MERHVLVTLLLLSLIMFRCSDASFVKDLRKLVALDPKTRKDSQPPSGKPDPNPVDDPKKNKEDPPATNNDNNNTNSPASQPEPSHKVENVNVNGNQKKTNNAPPPASPPPIPKKADDDGGSKDKEEKKETNTGINFSHSATNDTCIGLNTCTDDGDMLACIFKIDPKYMVVLVRNSGDGAIKAKLRSDFESNLGDVEVDKNKTQKINITRMSSQSTQLTLNAGKEDCVLHMVTHVPEGSFFVRLPSYDKILTPVNGAYFLILTVLVFGGTWACCMFRKKRQDEVPYQELEMALPESVATTNEESAEGWDQGWDDDWDDDVAVKSPSVRHAGSISANGLTSRSSNKDGWENNWDD